MGRIAHYIPGDNWTRCDRCGFTYRRSQVKTEWTGLVVCKPCWEPRHPQDYVQGGADDMTAPQPIRPDPDNVQAVTNIGDNNVTLTVGTSTTAQTFSDPLTANRTVTLSTSGASSGDQFIIQKIRTDIYSVDIGGLFTILPGEGASATVEYNGAAWELKYVTRF